MAMFPDIRKYTITRDRERPLRKTNFASGIAQTAPKYTKGQRTFTLNYSYLTDAEVDTLDDFFEENQGQEFAFLFVKKSEIITAKFDMEKISFSALSPIYSSTTIQLREVPGSTTTEGA